MKNNKVVLLCFLLFMALNASAQEDVTGGATTQSTPSNSGSVNIQQDQRLQNIVSGEVPVVERSNKTESNTATQNGSNQSSNGSNPRQSQPKKVQRTQVVPLNELPAFGQKNNFDVRRGTRQRMRGFRIQMYWGNSQRTDYLKAKRFGDKVTGAFPELKSYVSFDQPHWRCRVGDFKTRSGAARYLERMRKIAPEAMIVRSEIYIYQ